MYSYIPISPEKEKLMLEKAGVEDIEMLFSHIPEKLRLNKSLDIGEGMSESELIKHMTALADKNKTVDDNVCFLGAGAYDRYIPSVIRHLASRSEFYTAYTPYQPEISQGTLQSIFEFQSMIAELTGMDVANASMYDGASACAEAALMAVKHSRNRKILISETVNPETKKVVDTYCRFNDVEIDVIPEKGGITDLSKLKEITGDDIGGVIIQSPNFFGQIEDIAEISETVHECSKALMIVSISDLLAYAVLKSPGDCGADVVVGEGQSLGIRLNFGGPYLGFMSATEKLTRKLPGRIVGQTKDTEGNRAFVLTLQAREQHIRREKATSNICSNQGLNALMATMYMSLLGRDGMIEVAERSIYKTRYAMNRLTQAGFSPVYDGPCFDEFVIDLNDVSSSQNPIDEKEIIDNLLDRGVLCGYPLGSGKILICVTEKRTKIEIDTLAELIEGAVKQNEEN